MCAFFEKIEALDDAIRAIEKIRNNIQDEYLLKNGWKITHNHGDFVPASEYEKNGIILIDADHAIEYELECK